MGYRLGAVRGHEQTTAVLRAEEMEKRKGANKQDSMGQPQAGAFTFTSSFALHDSQGTEPR